MDVSNSLKFLKILIQEYFLMLTNAKMIYQIWTDQFMSFLWDPLIFGYTQQFLSEITSVALNPLHFKRRHHYML